MKVPELIGQALDWAVAVAESMNPRFFTERQAYEADVLTQTLKNGDYVVVLRPNNRLTCLGQYNGYNDGVCWKNVFTPSTNWSQGGPIIDREKISTISCDTDYQDFADAWIAERGAQSYSESTEHQCHDAMIQIYVENDGGRFSKDGPFYGPTLLIAAMRCYVASKLGNEVEIPKELL